MDKEKIVKKIKILIVILVLFGIVWFLLLNPIIKFKSNENTMIKASKRYFEVNSSELPTGNRIKTIYLKDLYTKGFLKDDFYVPLTSKACSVTDSWVKVKKVNGEYKYYGYLKCGILSSTVDHKGPEIVLNGNDIIKVNKGDKYTELGVKSITDNNDGKIDVNSVSINSKNVDTNKIGTYEVTYTAFDSLGNKTVVTRKVKIVSRLKNVVKKATNGLGYYKGIDPNNYIYLSGMLFRIVGITNGNVKIIASEDIANINYSGIEEWLDNYYYDHLTNKAKKYIVESKYCNMNINDNTIDTTNCTSYTKKRKSYIVSIDDINKSLDSEGSYLKPKTISWTANKFDKNKSYVTRDIFFGNEYGKNYITMSSKDNYGIRPVITIKGSSLIKSGDGTYENPYSLGDLKKAKDGSMLNTRYSGEYIEYSGYLWRIIATADDGTTKVICDDNIKDDGSSVNIYYETQDDIKIYNPNQKGNIGYYIKNKISEYIKTDYFVKKEIKVPIYEKYINYNKEKEVKKYKVKLSAPNAYEMFSAFNYKDNSMQSYWLINSSKKEDLKGAVSDIGVIFDGDIDNYKKFGIRPVGYMKKTIKIVNGNGTSDNPYTISD